MNYSKKEIGFILYNNRSPEMISKNIDKDINPYELIKIEKEFDWSKSIFDDLENFVEVDISLLSPDSEDVIYNSDEIKEITDYINSKIGKFSENESNFLKKRKKLKLEKSQRKNCHRLTMMAWETLQDLEDLNMNTG